MSKTSTWIPPPGRHEVQIGASLVRTLRARKGLPQPKRPTHMPDKEFFALRYNFKPSSMDLTKAATLNKTSTSKLVVEHPSTSPEEVHVFLGEETPAKDYLCVLVYDESTGGFTLEKVESSISLNNDRRASTTLNRPVASSSTATSSVIPDTLRREEEEESESEPLSQSVLPPEPKPPQPDNLPPRKEIAKPPAKGPKKAGKRVVETDDLVEELEFGKPPKRIKTTPEVNLELPGPSTSAVSLPGSQLPEVNGSDSEEDWDEIAFPPQPPSPQVDDGEGEEIDLDELETLMNQELVEEEDDFLAAAVSPEPDSRPSGPPMSLRQIAGADMSEDEYSSSEDSDED